MNRGELEDRDIIDSLLYVKRMDEKYGGWKMELLTPKMESGSESVLLTCTSCRGLQRDASIVQTAETEEMVCSVCINPSIVQGVIAARTNRSIINQKHVSRRHL